MSTFGEPRCPPCGRGERLGPILFQKSGSALGDPTDVARFSTRVWSSMQETFHSCRAIGCEGGRERVCSQIHRLKLRRLDADDRAKRLKAYVAIERHLAQKSGNDCEVVAVAGAMLGQSAG